MKTLPYRQAFERIRAEFLEMPGMHVTPDQVARLSGVDSAICKAVLDDLVRAEFLSISANGSYSKLSDTSTSGTESRRGRSRSVQRPSAERGAS
jgi:hypothetical protein